jgi:hypothetical protein
LMVEERKTRCRSEPTDDTNSDIVVCKDPPGPDSLPRTTEENSDLLTGRLDSDESSTK